MIKYRYIIIVILLGVIGLNFSCNNKVDINDDYKEISIAYCLLNPTESRHYVKFTKAFQSEGNVYLAAADKANSQYSPDDLDIKLIEYSNGNPVKSIQLDSVLITNKDSGAFYFPNQIVYATPEGTFLNPSSEYKLKAEVKSTGNIVESKTKLIQDFLIVKPIALTQYLDFSGNYTQSVKFRSAENGKLYQLVIRYFYTDVYPNGNTEAQYVDWEFNQQRSQTTDGGESIEYEFLGSSFYSILAAEIPPATDGLKRYSDSLYYIFEVADEDFTIYMDVNSPSNSIVQDRPAYTNISNGMGLLASRYLKIRFFEGLAQKSLDSLYNGSKTYNLGFEDRP
jgi:hypothetical protein